MTLVRFEGAGIEPLVKVIDIEVVPRKGEYVSMGDGVKRHVAYIEHKLDSAEFDTNNLVWHLNPKRSEATIHETDPRIHIFLLAGSP